MEQKNTTFETLIARMQNEKPQIPQPEMLTESILSSLPEKTGNFNFLQWTRVFSTAAAVFLLLVFSFQQHRLSNTDFAHNSALGIILNEQKTTPEVIEKSQFLQLYRNYMLNNSIKNKKMQSYIKL